MEEPSGDRTARVGRRRLLLAGAAAVSAVVAARLAYRSIGRRSKPPSAGSEAPPVALVGCDSYGHEPLGAAVERGLSLCPPPDVRGRRVVLKPNFVEYHADRPITTHIELLREVARRLRDLGARELVIAEGPGHNRDTDEVWYRSGLYQMASEEGVAVVDLNVDDVSLTHLKTFAASPAMPGRALEYLYLPRTVLTADLLVSIPKLKTHHWAGFTLSMKNLFGVVPSVKYGWPKNVLHTNSIPRSVVELAASVAPGYSIVDGIEGMEGDGPIMGRAVASHCLLFGRSAYAVDWVGTRVMGIDPTRTDVVRLAAAAGLGTLSDPPLLGESLSTLRREFEIPPQFDELRG